MLKLRLRDLRTILSVTQDTSDKSYIRKRKKHDDPMEENKIGDFLTDLALGF